MGRDQTGGVELTFLNMKTVKINEAIKVPGTSLILEAGDKIFF